MLDLALKQPLSFLPVHHPAVPTDIPSAGPPSIVQSTPHVLNATPMSKPHAEPVNGAPATLATEDRGRELLQDHADLLSGSSSQRADRPIPLSLLTQALQQQSESDGDQFDDQEGASPSHDDPTTPTANSYGGAKAMIYRESPVAAMATTSLPEMAATFTTEPSPLCQRAKQASSSNLLDMRHLNSLLMRNSELFRHYRCRSTSLERTEIEKRVEGTPPSRISSYQNAGDTGFAHASPTPLTLDAISTTPPLDGFRAQYRSWRDPRTGMAEEKTWSIGGRGSEEDGQEGQVEKSIAETLAGVEASGRSRKTSHSLGFFREGLPESKHKKRDGKGRGEGKDKSRKGEETLAEEPAGYHTDETTPGLSEAPSISHTPAEGNVTPTEPAPSSHIESVPADGYFNITDDSGNSGLQEHPALPAQLLAEIRKQHNLTPGAEKGTSFSQSIPVPVSQKSKPSEDSSETTPVKQRHDSDTGTRSTKSQDEDEDSGEEQISSALFVPHQGLHDHQSEHETSEVDRLRPESRISTRSGDTEEREQWLVEHKPTTPKRKPGGQSGEKDLNLPSPTVPPAKKEYFQDVMPKTPRPEFARLGSKGALPQAPSDEGETSATEDTKLLGDLDTTPKSNLKSRHLIPPSEKKNLHSHQQGQKAPLEAVELIPYRHQVGGHTTMWRFSKRAVCKQLNSRENEFYEKVEQSHPKLLKFLPRYVDFCSPHPLVGLEAETKQRLLSPRIDLPLVP